MPPRFCGPPGYPLGADRPSGRLVRTDARGAGHRQFRPGETAIGLQAEPGGQEERQAPASCRWCGVNPVDNWFHDRVTASLTSRSTANTLSSMNGHQTMTGSAEATALAVAARAGDEAAMREDAVFRMPPEPGIVVDREAIFKAWSEGGFGSEAFGRVRCVTTRANRQLGGRLPYVFPPFGLPLTMDAEQEARSWH